MKYLFPLFLLLVSICACQNETTTTPKSTSKDILTFSFKQAANPTLSNDIEGVITGKEIKIALPSSVALNGLKATFTNSSLSSVSINGIKQESGSTANDFSNPVMYRVTAEDGSTSDYTVTASKVFSAEKQLLSFAVSFKSFSGKDVVSQAKISGNTFTVFLPPHIDSKSIKPIFTSSKQASVTIKNVAQKSGESVVDLSNAITYTVTAEDKTTQEYTIIPKSINEQVDNLIKSFVQKYNVTGLTFAISNREKLAYAKGYGIANKANNTAVTPSSLFRVASVSKPIAAIAIMKLVENEKLNLESKVFGDNGIFGNKYGGKPYKSGYENITVKHLLEHTSGLATNDGNDPMFSAFNLTHDQIIDNTVKTRNLYATPGTKYYYSNFGYCVLGRIIEKVSGLTFEQFLQKEILKPIGIEGIQVTGSSIANRKANEVVYYNPTYDPYFYNVPRMDSHGGLIASSIDLVKLISYVDGSTIKPDILKPQTIATMTKFNSTTGYSLGWSVNQSNNWWHTGLITGTSSQIVRASNGFSWAIITNYGRVDAKDSYSADLDNLGWNIINAIKEWPEYDLF